MRNRSRCIWKFIGLKIVEIPILTYVPWLVGSIVNAKIVLDSTMASILLFWFMGVVYIFIVIILICALVFGIKELILLNLKWAGLR